MRRLKFRLRRRMSNHLSPTPRVSTEMLSAGGPLQSLKRAYHLRVNVDQSHFQTQPKHFGGRVLYSRNGRQSASYCIHGKRQVLALYVCHINTVSFMIVLFVFSPVYCSVPSTYKTLLCATVRYVQCFCFGPNFCCPLKLALLLNSEIG